MLSVPQVSFQSTLPRRERQCSLRYSSSNRNISIHAPAKGATVFLDVARADRIISIHAPAKGATAEDKVREGVEVISIHAPAKGATVSQARNPSFPRVFQSTLPRRERHGCTSPSSHVCNFNPRSREGSDRQREEHRAGSGHFNPRSREGSDESSSSSRLSPASFQSTLPRRERPCPAVVTVWQAYFNPRSREGSDSPVSSPLSQMWDFNPRSREGSDQHLTN